MATIMSRDRLDYMTGLVQRVFDGSNAMEAAQSKARKELADWAERLTLFANLNPASLASEAVAKEAENIREMLLYTRHC